MTVIKAGMHGKSRSELTRAVENCLEFKTSGSLSGDSYNHDLGELPDPYRAEYDKGTKWSRKWLGIEPSETDIVYTVRSYRTPIAWVLRNGDVVRPHVKYSNTTSHHQGAIYGLNNAYWENHPHTRSVCGVDGCKGCTSLCFTCWEMVPNEDKSGHEHDTF